jgi:class 3 adenylate cyclase
MPRETLMERKPTQRRLAAVLAADVVGYSRLMSVDEMSTLTSLKAHRRELIDPRSPDIMGVSSRRPAMAR